MSSFALKAASRSLFSLCIAGVSAACLASDLVIKNARIEVGNGRVIESGGILIRDGKIAEVGADVSAPEGVEVFDAKGLTVYPGFIDAFSTKGVKPPAAPEAATPPDTRTTAPPTMWHENRKGIRSDVVAADCLDLGDLLKSDPKEGVTTAFLSPGTGIISGVGSVIDFAGSGSVLSKDAGVGLSFRPGGAQPQRGPGGGGGGGRRQQGQQGQPGQGRQGGGQGQQQFSPTYPQTLFGFTAELRQSLADAQYYCGQAAPKKDAGFENLRPLVQGEIPAVFSADTAREVYRAVRLADGFHLKLIVVGASEGYKDAALLRQKKVSVVASLDIGDAPSTEVKDEPDATPKPILQERYNTWLEHSKNVKSMIEAGVPVAFENNGSSMETYLEKVRKIIGTGVGKEAALEAMTSVPASMFGVSDKVGTLEQGKLANLVLMNGDFADSKSEIKAVFVEGNKVGSKKEEEK